METERFKELGGIWEWPTGNALSVVGVDIGQRQDHSAIAVVEDRRAEVGRDRARFEPIWEVKRSVRYLERMPLGTSFTEVVERVGKVVNSLRGEPARAVVVDAAGVGRPVVELLEQARLGCKVVAVWLTSGGHETWSPGQWNVPKRDVVTNLQVLLEKGVLKISGQLKEAGLLLEEMQGMRVKVSLGGSEQYAAWREGSHDDLVLAVGLGCWWLSKMDYYRKERDGRRRK